MNRAERIYRLNRLLNESRKPVSLNLIKEELDCSTSTARRTIEYYKIYIGAPVEYNNKQNGYYYDGSCEKFELPGFWLTSDEIYALFTCHEVIEKNKETGLSSLIEPLNKKIETILKNLGHSPEILKSKIKVMPLFSRKIQKNNFAQICSALIKNQIIEIQYFKRDSCEKSERKLHPQRIVHYKNNWYLIAFCEKKNELRTFSVENIEVLSSEKECSHLPEKTIDTFIEDSFGIFSGKAEKIARLRFYSPDSQWVKDEFWHKKENKYFDGNDLILEVPYGNPTELIMEILRHGDSVIVESPEELKNAVIKKLSKTIKNYGG